MFFPLCCGGGWREIRCTKCMSSAIWPWKLGGSARTRIIMVVVQRGVTMGSKKFGPNQNFLDMGQKAKLRKVNVSYHVPCALFHCFFSQISNEIFCNFVYVSYFSWRFFSYFHGQNTNAKFDFLSIVAFALKISQDIHKIFTFWNSNAFHFSNSKEF